MRSQRASKLLVLVAVALVGLGGWVVAARAEEPVFIRTVYDPIALTKVNSPLDLSDRSHVLWANTQFDLTYGSGLSSNQQAKDAFGRAAARWSALLMDPITVKITVDYQSLGTGILGQTSTQTLSGGYNTVRSLVVTNAGETNNTREVALLPNIPVASQFSAYLPTGFGMNGYSYLSQANYHALGGTLAASYTNPDGTITFSSNYQWDFDPSNGIDAGKYDFEGAAVHEIGHALGFISEVDYVDSVLHEGLTASDVWPTPLDMFRFKTDDLGTGFNFTTTARDLAPGGSHSFYYSDGSVLMATGTYYGDGRQASHWKDDLGLGVMDPTMTTGEILAIMQNDLIALDLIGWQIVPEPATLALVALGGLALLRRRGR